MNIWIQLDTCGSNSNKNYFGSFIFSPFADQFCASRPPGKQKAAPRPAPGPSASGATASSAAPYTGTAGGAGEVGERPTSHWEFYGIQWDLKESKHLPLIQRFEESMIIVIMNHALGTMELFFVF